MRKTKTDGMQLPIQPSVNDRNESAWSFESDMSQPSTAITPEAVVDAFYERMKTDPLTVTISKERISIAELCELNEGLSKSLTKPWSERFWEIIATIAEVYGITLHRDENGKLIATPIPIPTVNTIAVSKQAQDAKSARPSMTTIGKTILARCRCVSQRIWVDITSCFWKSFAYYVAALGFGFGLFQWWECHRTTDALSKELKIIRMVVNSDSGGKEILKSIDADIRNYGLDNTYTFVNRAVEDRNKKVK